MRFRLVLGKHMKIKEEVEKGLGSLGNLKILRLLMKNPDHAFTRYKIGKSVPLDPVSIRNDLKKLVEIGWVIEFKVQHLSKYSINLENDRVRHLIDFFREVGYV